MKQGQPTLGKFILYTFLSLPPCFAAWYFTAKYLAAIAGGAALGLIGLLTSGVVSSMEQPGLDLLFVTTIKVHPVPGQTAIVVPEVNSLIYTYGIAFFLALMLAGRARWWKIIVGALVLLFFQAWGIAFDFLMQIGVKLGPEAAAQAGLAGWRVEAIALCYQLGVLIFPTLIPVMLWGVFCRPFIDSVIRARGSANASQAG